MLPRRLLFGILILLGLTAAGVAAAREVGQHQPTYYNCLYLSGGLQVQLNTHLSPIETYAVSPDGDSLFGGIQANGSRLLFIEDTRTGERIPIQWVPYVQPGTVSWFPDSERVYYGWYDKNLKFHATLFSRQERRLTDLVFDSTYSLSKFSADGNYAVLRGGGYQELILFPQDDPPSIHYVGTGHEWSPTGNRVAYFKNGYLVVADLDQGTTEQTLLPHPEFLDGMPYAPIRWSPNGHHLSVEFNYTVPAPAVIDLFSIENGTPSLLAELPFELGSYSSYWTVHWPQNDRQFSYIMRTDRGTYELWSFDLETHQRRLVIPESELETYGLNDQRQQLVTLRKEGDSLLLEYRDTDVTTPRFVRELQNNENVMCDWSWSDVLQCSGLTENPGRIFLDMDGQTIWPTKDFPPNTRPRMDKQHATQERADLHHLSTTGRHKEFFSCLWHLYRISFLACR